MDKTNGNDPNDVGNLQFPVFYLQGHSSFSISFKQIFNYRKSNGAAAQEK